jgi:23S rRNA (cytosine1962-C5)-methyltransferase
MDYELIDSGAGRRLERFGKYILNRPDPEVMWSKNLEESEWDKADAKFIDDKWVKKPNFPEKWELEVNSLKVNLKLTPFKHVGIFPEQIDQWSLIQKLTANSQRQLNVLNLFGYTGVASLHALSAGAKVTHLDASRPAITWFKENQTISGLEDKPARIIIDDAIKFTSREIKRGVKYDGIIMDPPVYGHGPHGEKWSFAKDFPILLDNVSKILTEKPLFVIVNAYAISTSSTSLANMLRDKLKEYEGTVTNGELSLKETSGGRELSTGIWAIWQPSRPQD